METRQTMWDGLPGLEDYISARHPSSFYKRQHHHGGRRPFATSWMQPTNTPRLVDICHVLDTGPPPPPPLDTPSWSQSYTTEPFVFVDLNEGGRRTVPLSFQPPLAPQFNSTPRFMNGHVPGWGETSASEHMSVDEDSDEYVDKVDAEDEVSSTEEMEGTETVMGGHQESGLGGLFENVGESSGEKEDDADQSLHETVKRLKEEVKELKGMMRCEKLEFERLRGAVAEMMEYLAKERHVHWENKWEQGPRTHNFSGGVYTSQTRQPSTDNPTPSSSRAAIEEYNTAWKAVFDTKSTSNGQHWTIPWPTSSLKSSPLSRNSQPSRGLMKHRRLPKEISEDIFQLRKWNAFCFFVQAFGLYPTYVHADSIRRETLAPEEPREGIVFDIRIRGASRAKLNALKAQMVQEKLRWHPDRLKRYAGGFRGDEEEAAKAVLSAVLDSSRACNKCLELVGRGH
ncbi:hypothetical protein H112_05563 [Trichophyton rubrum D6]|uniref:Uncharacterized protein n=4 Tax=Trichophyton TaxID=5550 RepID=A0A178EQ75_TRIRU|nr:uncharacterized protein TERG_03297 [Trichophyton rubrum CBS 118892]EZF16922.1 hypothetical protein H100_05581 [Trichophyton rubrum MR850]EZF40520.1 hypothetical protein H102_05548 [Trichophyton rubrum CBS 100081]EZF51205.1 hypothetical protein H103_05571 [Trichophyton rubrum CBS 288.86]EZF61744.1 hypothetical protein H104_05562 [Trichophyton rubrum CBS 289.86]EZF72222.1 hypothetical protein H105_05589 [Trichophyton soudanense CBS 452.61]EZF82881.1 hypothetical protein H110_05571 [Trichophy